MASRPNNRNGNREPRTEKSTKNKAQSTKNKEQRTKNKEQRTMLSIARSVALVLLVISTALAQRSSVDYVNVFVGTGGHGHTYPGATMPFGMVQLSPDTRLTGWDGC